MHDDLDSQSFPPLKLIDTRSCLEHMLSGETEYSVPHLPMRIQGLVDYIKGLLDQGSDRILRISQIVDRFRDFLAVHSSSYLPVSIRGNREDNGWWGGEDAHVNGRGDLLRSLISTFTSLQWLLWSSSPVVLGW